MNSDVPTAAAVATAILGPHQLKVALLQPQIAPNTGNIARLCVATGTDLHLVRPLGFFLDDRNLRRSAMDYWPRLRHVIHDDTTEFLKKTSGAGSGGRWLLSSKGERSIWDASFEDGDWLIFGNETHGIDASLLASHRDDVLRIPQAPGERCLNLSTAVGIVLYEALRQLARGRKT